MLCWLCYWPWSDQIRCEFGWEVFNRRLRKVLYCPSGHLAPFLNHVHWPFIALERPFCRLESGVKATGLVSQTFPERFGEFLYTNSEEKKHKCKYKYTGKAAGLFTLSYLERSRVQMHQKGKHNTQYKHCQRHNGPEG